MQFRFSLLTAALVGASPFFSSVAAAPVNETAHINTILKRAAPSFLVRDLSGPGLTSQFGSAKSDLGIPVRAPSGEILFISGDTFAEHVGDSDWRSPVAFISSSSDLNNIKIDGSVGGSHAVGLVPEGHIALNGGRSTAIPSDAFTIGNTMYMHLMRGKIYDTDHSDFWQSTDNGRTWTYLCQWPGSMLGGAFQQKTYALADDGYAYVLSTVFNRDVTSPLLLHRVRQDSVGNPAAYQPWGYNNGWAWGNPATSISSNRKWGEICFRAIDGKYIFTFLNAQTAEIRAQVLALPTSNFFTTNEQQLIYNGAGTPNGVIAPYGGFVYPGTHLASLDFQVSQWPAGTDNYHFMQYRALLVG